MLAGMVVSNTLFWTRPAMLAMGKPEVFTITNAFTAITLILLSLLIVPSMGYTGSAILFNYPFIFGQIVVLYFLFIFYKKSINVGDGDAKNCNP